MGPDGAACAPTGALGVRRAPRALWTCALADPLGGEDGLVPSLCVLTECLTLCTESTWGSAGRVSWEGSGVTAVLSGKSTDSPGTCVTEPLAFLPACDSPFSVLPAHVRRSAKVTIKQQELAGIEHLLSSRPPVLGACCAFSHLHPTASLGVRCGSPSLQRRRQGPERACGLLSITQHCMARLLCIVPANSQLVPPLCSVFPDLGLLFPSVFTTFNFFFTSCNLSSS